jgi:hypothetical protein
MRVSAQAFSSPKAGNKESEYEDAFWPKRPLIGEKGATFRFAVADGATETSFSGIWARQLVRAFCKGELGDKRFLEELRVLREKWHKIASRKPMPWYAEEKIRSGAFAALIGLVLNDSSEPREDGKWSALAIGDSCVFQLREKELVTSFPIQSSDQFNNSPVLLSSRQPQDQADTQMLMSMQGTWRKGDTFYLMTDAVACWFLKHAESGRIQVRKLQDLSSSRSNNFQSWLTVVREHKSIRNDDVTIVRVEIEKL